MACKRAQSALALAVLAALAAADSVSAGMTCYIGSYCSGQQLGSSVSVGTCTPSIFGVGGYPAAATCHPKPSNQPAIPTNRRPSHLQRRSL